MSEECSCCKKQFNISDFKKSISCPACQAKYHSSCIIIKNKKWNCVKCSNETSSSSVTSINPKDEENVILKAIEEFRKENQASWVKNNKRWDNNDAKIAKVQADIEGTKQEIKEIKDSVEKVTMKCETACASVEELRRKYEHVKGELESSNKQLYDLQQHTRKNNLIVSGIPVTFKEDMFVVIQAIASALKVNFHYSEINAAHRLQSRKGDNRPPSIVISFTSRFSKYNWLSARRMKGSLSARDLNSSFSDTPVYINEHLTAITREIFNASRKMVKDKILSSVWTHDGVVMARRDANQHPFRIHDLDQVAALRERRASAAAPTPTSCEDATPTPPPRQDEANSTPK